MTIIYVHGVKVREPDHGIRLGRSFNRWLGPKIAVNGEAAAYVPVYWGDAGARFRWDLATRPKTALLKAGGTAEFPGLGSLREASTKSPLDRPRPQPADGAVIRTEVSVSQRSA